LQARSEDLFGYQAELLLLRLLLFTLDINLFDSFI